LQSRKIKYIVDEFSRIHSIDRDEIAIKLNTQLAAANKLMPALFEINLSGEESKSGYAAREESSWLELCDHFIELKKLSNLEFCGFMTMPPFTNDPEESRPVFAKCRKLLEMMQKRSGQTRFNQLSMGTSLDYEVAIQEGATFIRIGEAIMGKRVYK
jgi:pyridoxal phosphate enzyme (YggS family)